MIRTALLSVVLSILIIPSVLQGQGIVKLENESTDRCLNIHRGQHDYEGGPVTSYSCADTKDQEWKLKRLEDGNLRLKNRSTKRCLNIHRGRHDYRGAPVTSYSCADTPDQEWELTHLSNGNVKLRNIGTGRCLNIHRGEHDYQGAPVTAYSCADTPDQEWEISYVGGLVRNFRHCSSEAKVNIREVIAFMDENQRALKHEFKLAKRRGKRRRIRRRFNRKIHKMRFGCAKSVLCRDSAPRVALHPLGIASRKIRVCYDKIEDAGTDFCDLVNIVSHEFGHAIGIKKDRAGRHHKNRNDRVYKFGDFVESLCRSQGRNRSL